MSSRKTSTMGADPQNLYYGGYSQAAQTPQYGNTFPGSPPQQNEYQNGYTPSPQPQQRVLNAYPQDMAPAPSNNAVARRNETFSRALVPMASRNGNFDADLSNQYASAENALVPALNVVDPEQQQLVDAIARAEKVAEEAQSDRPGAVKKSIPPFVQKLATFLNRGTDQELIRWSDKGDSFIVYDEDEFARSLIPQLFKHSNYASFVRQLNMYGFHKRVGLADNSMRSSENKNKAPSEYAHPYFRRGYDILQWLIVKPKKNEKQGEKRKAPGTKREETYDIDSDEEYDDAQSKANAIPGTVAKTEFNRISAQLSEMQANQQHVLNLINNLRNSQTEIMHKALSIERNNQRHDTSINSILSFLANVFRKSMEGRNPEFAEMLAGMLRQANAGMPNGSAIPTGSVQDLSDASGQENLDQQQQTVGERRIMSPGSRRQHLLPGIPANNVQSRAGTPVRPSGYQTPTVTQAPQESSRVTEVYETSPEDTTSPFEYINEPVQTPEAALTILLNANNADIAALKSNMEMPQAKDSSGASFANSAAVFAREQRRRMLHSMPAPMSPPQQNTPQNNQQNAQRTSQQGPAQRTAQNTTRLNSHSPAPGRSSISQGNQTSLAYHAPSSTAKNIHAPSPVAKNIQNPQAHGAVAAHSNFQTHQQNDTTSALSNLMTSLPVPEPSILGDVSQTQAQFQDIENLQRSMDEGLGDLANLLPSYDSYSGLTQSIDHNDYFDLSADFDPSQYMNQDPNLYLEQHDFGMADNFGFDSGAGSGGFPGAENTAPTNGTIDTPSPAATEEIVRDDLATEMPSAKRARAS